MDLDLAPNHNIIPYLIKLPLNQQFHEIIDFLTNCKLSFALTVNPSISITLLQQFWANASAVKVNGKVIAIKSVIAQNEVQINESNLCLHLDLKDDASGIDSFIKSDVDKTFRDLLGYEGPEDDKRKTIFKLYFEPKFKFLVHTVLQTFTKKRAAWEQIPVRVQFLIHSLVRNLDFNVSRYLLDDLVTNLTSTTRFLMYPRFLMVVLTKELGESFHLPADLKPMEAQSEMVFRIMKRVRKHSGRITPLPPTMVVTANSQDQEEEGVNVESGDVADKLQSRLSVMQETVKSLIDEHCNESGPILDQISSIKKSFQPRGVKCRTIDLERSSEETVELEKEQEGGSKSKGDAEVIVIEDDGDDGGDDGLQLAEKEKKQERERGLKRKAKDVMLSEEGRVLNEELGLGRTARILDNLEEQLQELLQRRDDENFGLGV